MRSPNCTLARVALSVGSAGQRQRPAALGWRRKKGAIGMSQRDWLASGNPGAGPTYYVVIGVVIVAAVLAVLLYARYRR